MSSKACHHPGRIPRGLAEVLRERGESREGGELPTDEEGGGVMLGDALGLCAWAVGG